MSMMIIYCLNFKYNYLTNDLLILQLRCDLEDCFKALKRAGINSILVEGGANIIQSVLEFELANQVVVTIRPCFLGGYRSLTHELPRPLNLINIAAASVGGDIVIFGKLSKSDSPVETAATSAEVSPTSGENVCPPPEENLRSLVEFLE